MTWKNLDIEAVLARRNRQHEATMSGNVGAFVVPLGTVLRPPQIDPMDTTRSDWPSGGIGVSPGFQSVEDALNAYARATRSR